MIKAVAVNAQRNNMSWISEIVGGAGKGVGEGVNELLEGSGQFLTTIKTIVKKYIRKTGGDDDTKTIILKCPRRMLAARSATKICTRPCLKSPNAR